MKKRLNFRTPGNHIRSIETFSEEDIFRSGETFYMTASQKSITVTKQLRDSTEIYKEGVLLGTVSELDYYSIESSFVLTTTSTFYGGEKITIKT